MNFTYLLGAGASALKMPVIKTFEKRLGVYTQELSSLKLSENRFPPEFKNQSTPENAMDLLTDDLEWLIKECKNHSSIDTFARKLYLTNKTKELYKLKSLVSDFMLYEQMMRGVDKRYDTFFATILKHDEVKRLVKPENINILTWNYDKQIEFSFGQFYNQGKADQDSIENFLNIYPRKTPSEIDRTCFSIIKLNGTLGGKYSSNDGYSPIPINYGLNCGDISVRVKNQLVIQILNRHSKIRDYITTGNIEELNKLVPTILYSWEDNDFTKSLRQYTSAALASHHILIIIGYSFPTFNRETDKFILKQMSGLKQIYIQSPIETLDGVTVRLSSLLGSDHIKIEEIENTEEFYIPFEY